MPPLSIMIKPSSSLCNMRCKYCFYHDVTDSREVKSYGFISKENTQKLIEKALKFASGDSIYFAFQGGEPLLAGLDYFRFFVTEVNKLNSKHSKIYYSLQTNGLLINEEFAEFFKQNNFLLGVSLDGDRNANKFRFDSHLKPVFNQVSEATKILDKYNVDYNILIVATGYTAEHINEVYKYLTGQGYKYLQFIPCLRPFGDKSEGEMYMTVPQYEKYLIYLFNDYVKDYVDGKYTSIRHFDNMVRLYLGQDPEQCGMRGHCTHQFVIEGNGNVYPCDFYCIDKWLLGNIAEVDFESLANSDKAKAFISESLVIPDKCKSCKYRRICRSCGCKRNREDRDYCAAYYSFFEKCLPLFRVFANEKARKI